MIVPDHIGIVHDQAAFPVAQPLAVALGKVHQGVGRGPDGFKGGFQLGQLFAATPPGHIAERVIRRVQPVVLADGVGWSYPWL